MADNFLEKRYEEVFGKASSVRSAQLKGPGLESLVRKAGCCLIFDSSYEVKDLQLQAVVRVNSLIGSFLGGHHLSFVTASRRNGAEKLQRSLVQDTLKCGQPCADRGAEAFIIICSDLPESPALGVDLGISVQSMLLKAAELGLKGMVIGNFAGDELRKAFDLPSEPHLILAIGKEKK